MWSAYRGLYLKIFREKQKNKFNAIKIDSRVCQRMNGDHQMIKIPCKHIPFKALRGGETVKLSFKLKQKEIK
jgi:hypothetical protein